METKQLLVTAAEVVAFLFVAFSGFLTNIAPPEADANFAIGISSFIALMILLFAKALSTRLPKRKFMVAWGGAALIFFVGTIVTGFVYKSHSDQLTFAYPPGNTKAEYVKGTEMTPRAKEYKERTGRTDAEVVAAFEGLANRDKVWEPESIRRSRQTLVLTYVVLVLTMASAIFSLTEGLLPKKRQKRGGVTASPPTEQKLQ
jgi:hypothetical protein